MESLKIESILFDLDGTLIDSERDIVLSLKEAYQSLNLKLDVDKIIIGPTLEEIIKILSPEADEALRHSIITEFRKNYLSSSYTNTVTYQGVIKTLDLLKKQNKRLFIATNKPEKGSERVLNTLHLTDYFEFVGTPDCIAGRILSKTEIIAHILSTYQLDASKTLMVGDTVPDMIAGKNNKTYTLAFTGGYGAAEELLEQKPDFCINHFEEIINKIK